MHKDLRKLIARIEAAGGTVNRTRKNHWQVRNQENRIVAVLPSTPSDVRSMRNCLADMKRGGLDV